MDMKIKQRVTPLLTAAALILAGCVSSEDAQGAVNKNIADSTPHWVEPVSAKPDSPNIVIILLDDAGFSDFGAFGAEIETPNIDHLAENGLSFNNFTTTAVCSPSRAALLTGLNHHSAGVGWLANMDTGFPGYRGEIATNAVTLPEVLKENGYNTMMVGKWHLINSSHLSVAGPYDAWPTQRGFERYWGFLDGESNQFTPAFLYAGNEVIQTELPEDFYFPEAMTDKAIQMLKDQRATARDKPFFLYYASGGPHAPHHTKPEDRAKYRGRYNQGYDEIRAARLAKQKQLGIAPGDTDLTPHLKSVVPWDELTDDDRKVSARLQENFAAYVDQLDQQIGRLVEYLRETGELDNTIIVVSSDNGGSKETGVLGTTMATRYLHGIADTTEKNLEDYESIGSPESHPNYPLGWTQVSNTPFNYTKATTHGGGVRDPLIIHWPQRITDKGAVRTQFHHINDVMPTLLEATGIQHPASYRGQQVKPMEGTSMAYTFTDGDSSSRKPSQYYELAANRAFVENNWKIVTFVPRNQAYDSVPWELYNLADDFSEAHNLADQHPEKVKELEAKWWAAAERYNVLPVDDRPIMKKGAASMKRKKNLRYKHFSYQPGLNTIHNIQAPTLIGQPFSISAKLSRDNLNQGGVIAAQGGYDVGYTLYIKDNHLNYEVNIGGYHTIVASTQALPKGEVSIRATFTPGKNKAGDKAANKSKTDGDFDASHLPQGTITLYINDQAAGSKHFAPPVPFNSWEGLDIGRDLRTAVSKAYKVPFTFEGHIESVNYDIH